MAQFFRLEFKEDRSGHRGNQLKKYGTGFQYLLGSDGFDPANKRDVGDLVSQLMMQNELREANERDLEYQISRMRKGDSSIQIRA